MSLNKPVCSFKELKESYRIALNALQNEKDQMQKDLHFTINVLTQRIKEGESQRPSLQIRSNAKDSDFELVEIGRRLDPKQHQLYIKKIDELTAKVKALETEGKGLKESLNFYRNSSAVKALAKTDKDLSITVLTKEEAGETREEIKERYETKLKEIKEQMEKNSLVLILKGEKDKFEAQANEANKLCRASLAKVEELQVSNDELTKKNEEYTRSILNLNTEKEKFKAEYIKTKTELKALIEYLKETKEVYEKEIEELNVKLANSEKIEAKSKKASNELNEVIVDYLISKYSNAHSISMFDILSQMISKMHIFKMVSSERLEVNNFIALMFTDVLSFLKFNPQCDIELFLNKFQLMTANDKKSFDNSILNKLQMGDGLDMELIEKKFSTVKKNMLTVANTSLEIMKNSLSAFYKEQQESASSTIFKLKPQSGDSNLLRNAISIDNTAVIIKGDELGKFYKSDVSYFLQVEISKIVDLALNGNVLKEYLFSILLNCNNIIRLSLDNFEINKTLSLIVLFIESFTKLKSLSISNSSLNEDNFTRICASLKSNQSIQTVSFNNNKITPEGLFQFADCLISNSSITQIDLSNNKIKDIDTFCSVINTNHDAVTNITLAGNPLTDHDFEAVGLFLGENKKLKCLDISKCKITQKGAHSLRNAIGKNATLEELVMNQVKFNEENITLLSSQGNYGLRSIEINDTELNEGCLMLLGNAINTLKVLERLYIKNTKAKSIGLTSLLALIETKESLKELHLEGNEITEDIIITFSTGQWTYKELPKVFLSQKLIPKKFIEAIRSHGCTVIVDE